MLKLNEVVEKALSIGVINYLILEIFVYLFTSKVFFSFIEMFKGFIFISHFVDLNKEHKKGQKMP